MSNEITPQTPYNDLPQYLTVRQAAAYLGRSYWLVYQAVKAGEVPHRRIGPKLIFIPKEYFSKTWNGSLPPEQSAQAV